MQPITPIHYHLIIEPDLTAFTFSGRAVITLHADAPVSLVSLHAIDLTVTRCEAETEAGRADAEVSVDPGAERMVIDLPITETVSGDITLTPSPSSRKAMPGGPFPASTTRWPRPRSRSK